MEASGDDEFSELCRDFEEMRKKLVESAEEEKVSYDKENKELISNISHDLKTPDHGHQRLRGRYYGRSGGFAGKAGQIHPHHLQ